MKKLITTLFLSVLFYAATAQGTDYNYERIRIGDAKHIVCGLVLSPDQSKLAISSIQGYPFYLYDWKNRKVLKKYNVGNWYAGSSVSYSKGGKYILLNQLYYLDFAPNKDREVNFEIINAGTGARVKRFEALHSVKFTPDEEYVITLTGDEVGFFNLTTGKFETSFTVPDATNSVAISPDGKQIAVSHKLYESDADSYPTLKRDKKAKKNGLKYKQEITIFDAVTFKKLYTVHELYEIIYKLQFSSDGRFLLVLNIPHAKQMNAGGRQSFINVINMETGQAIRRGFVSRSDYEPDFKLNHDGTLLGIISKSNRFMELHIYDFLSGKMLYRFQQAYRLFEKNDGGMIAADSRSTFVFLPDDKTVLMTMGNHLVLWDFTKDNQQ